MINESQSDSESTTQIAKAPNSIEQVHVSKQKVKEYSNLGVKPKEIVRSIRNEGNLVQLTFQKIYIFEIMKKRKDLVILK